MFFKIENYGLKFYSGQLQSPTKSDSGPLEIRLLNENNEAVAYCAFVPDAEPVPPPQIWNDGQGVNVWFKVSEWPVLIDLLRNEKPISLIVEVVEGPPKLVRVFLETARTTW